MIKVRRESELPIPFVAIGKRALKLRIHESPDFYMIPPFLSELIGKTSAAKPRYSYISSKARTSEELTNFNLNLPDDLIKSLTAFRDQSSPTGMYLVKGLPVDNVFDLRENSSISELILLSLASTCGTPVGYHGQLGGAIVHDFRPVKEHAQLQLGTGSVELKWHTEDAHTDYNPDFIALLCLQGDNSAQTLVSRFEPNQIDKDVIRTLQEPLFRIDPDESFSIRSSPSSRVAIFAGTTSRPSLRYDPLYTICDNTQAAGALKTLTDHFNEGSLSVTLEKGDLLLIDNRNSVHARSGYNPRYDKTDRWLKRSKVINREIPKNAWDSILPNVICD